MLPWGRGGRYITFCFPVFTFWPLIRFLMSSWLKTCMTSRSRGGAHSVEDMSSLENVMENICKTYMLPPSHLSSKHQNSKNMCHVLQRFQVFLVFHNRWKHFHVAFDLYCKCQTVSLLLLCAEKHTSCSSVARCEEFKRCFLLLQIGNCSTAQSFLKHWTRQFSLFKAQ